MAGWLARWLVVWLLHVLVSFGSVKYYDLFTGEKKGLIKLHPKKKDFDQGGIPWGGNAFDHKNEIL